MNVYVYWSGLYLKLHVTNLFTQSFDAMVLVEKLDFEANRVYKLKLYNITSIHWWTETQPITSNKTAVAAAARKEKETNYKTKKKKLQIEAFTSCKEIIFLRSSTCPICIEFNSIAVIWNFFLFDFMCLVLKRGGFIILGFFFYSF